MGSRSRRLLLVATLAAVGACGGPPDDQVPADEAGPAAVDTVIGPTDEAISLAQRIDEGLAFGAAAVRTVDVPGEQPSTVRLWREDGRPVKLMATEPGERRRETEHIVFYFEEDHLFFVREPYERYLFRDGRLVLVLDDQLDTLHVDRQQLARRERAVRERLDTYLAAFND